MVLNKGIVFLQGQDFKSKLWADHINAEVCFFVSQFQLIMDLLSVNKKVKVKVVYRYQNSQANLIRDLLAVITLLLSMVVCKLRKYEIFWIMHNVDRETIDRYFVLTALKRWVLLSLSKEIYVTDKYIKDTFFEKKGKVLDISFGEKMGGSLSKESLNRVKAVRGNVHILALVVGAAGEKYKHFSLLRELQELVRERGQKICFIVPDGVFPDVDLYINVPEKNIDEVQLVEYVDFIYRVNSDVSVPYTVYAAASAGIPLVTNPSYFLYDLVKFYGIGMGEVEFLESGVEEREALRSNMKRFLSDRSWSSLGRRLNRNI